MDQTTITSSTPIKLGTVKRIGITDYVVKRNTRVVEVTLEELPEVWTVTVDDKELFRGTFAGAYDYRRNNCPRVINPKGDTNMARTDAIAQLNHVRQG